MIGSLKRNLGEIKKKFKILGIGYYDIKIVNKRFEAFIKACNENFDLVFADPPYYDFDYKKFDDIYKIMSEGAILVLEASKRIEVGDLKNLAFLFGKKYGDTIICFYKK